LIVVGILNFLLLNYLLMKKGVTYKILGIYAIKIPTFMGIFNSPDALLKNAVELGVMAILLAIFMRFVYLKSGRRKALYNHTTAAL